jgi:hypothetical protein
VKKKAEGRGRISQFTPHCPAEIAVTGRQEYSGY